MTITTIDGKEKKLDDLSATIARIVSTSKKSIGCTVRHIKSGILMHCDYSTLNNPEWVFYDRKKVKE
jgi:hypothetical protein